MNVLSSVYALSDPLTHATHSIRQLVLVFRNQLPLCVYQCTVFSRTVLLLHRH